LLGRPIEGDELDTALTAVRSNGAVRGALETARAYAADAVAVLQPLGTNAGTDWLRIAVDQLFARVEAISPTP